MEYLPWIISLISGAIGGNVAGSLMKGSSLGTLGNSIAGIAGGGIGGSILSAVGLGAATGGGSMVGMIVGNLATGLVGGGVVMAVIGFIRKAMGNSSNT